MEKPFNFLSYDAYHSRRKSLEETVSQLFVSLLGANLLRTIHPLGCNLPPFAAISARFRSELLSLTTTRTDGRAGNMSKMGSVRRDKISTARLQSSGAQVG